VQEFIPLAGPLLFWFGPFLLACPAITYCEGAIVGSVHPFARQEQLPPVQRRLKYSLGFPRRFRRVCHASHTFISAAQAILVLVLAQAVTLFIQSYFNLFFIYYTRHS